MSNQEFSVLLKDKDRPVSKPDPELQLPLYKT